MLLNKKIKAVHLLTTQKRPISTTEKGKKMKFDNPIKTIDPRLIRHELRELRSNLLHWKSVEANAQNYINKRTAQIEKLEQSLKEYS